LAVGFDEISDSRLSLGLAKDPPSLRLEPGIKELSKLRLIDRDGGKWLKNPTNKRSRNTFER
jgi:hypothetical protein